MKTLPTLIATAGLLLACAARATEPAPQGCTGAKKTVLGSYTGSVVRYDEKGVPQGKLKLDRSGLSIAIRACNEQLNLLKIGPVAGEPEVWVDLAEVKINQDADRDVVICTVTQAAQKVDTTQPASAGSGGKQCSAPPK